MLTPSTIFLRNSCFALIFSVVFFYQKDESFGNEGNIPINQINFEDIYQEKALEDKIRKGFSKQRLIRLRQSPNDIRQL